MTEAMRQLTPAGALSWGASGQFPSWNVKVVHTGLAEHIGRHLGAVTGSGVLHPWRNSRRVQTRGRDACQPCLLTFDHGESVPLLPCPTEHSHFSSCRTKGNGFNHRRSRARGIKLLGFGASVASWGSDPRNRRKTEEGSLISGPGNKKP